MNTYDFHLVHLNVIVVLQNPFVYVQLQSIVLTLAIIYVMNRRSHLLAVAVVLVF